MSDDMVNTALAALAQAALPGDTVSTESLLRKAALRQQLKRAARGAAVLEIGLPMVVTMVCAAAIILLPSVGPVHLSPAGGAAIWLALAMFASAVVASGIQLFARS